MIVTRGWRRLCLLATVFIVGAMAVGAFFENEIRAQNWDPMQTRDYVERTLRYGGTFYENGLVNKGPLEPFVYRVAAAVTSWDGFWYAISAIILVVSAMLGWAAARTTRYFTGEVDRAGSRALGIAIGIGVFFHFALGQGDYAGVLYSRNMIVGLYAGAWLIGISARWWLAGRARWAALAVGILLGLGIQTLFISTIAAIGVGIAALSSIEDLDDEREYRASRRILVLTPILVFCAAPIYYVLRGRGEEFWSSYWTYNVYQNVATGRSFANQIVYGRDVILRYYRAWPVSLMIVVAFLAMMLALWKSMSRRERAIHAGITIWFLGAWAELVAGQRYSTHYYSILAVPTAIMAATVVGHVYRLVTDARGGFRTAAAWPLLAALLAIVAGGGGHLTLGLEAASSYSSVHRVAAERDAVEPGRQRTVRAVLDLVSRPGDPLLAWTEFPWTYLHYHRVSATRFIWKSFMLGQIYLGRSSPAYVLPKTWEWFADDMAESHPAAFLEETAMPLTEGTPFAAYVRNGFDKVYSGADNNIYLRRDQAQALLEGDRGNAFAPMPALGRSSSWTVHASSASLPADTPPDLADVLTLSDSLCTRISGTYRLAPGEDGSFLSFRFDRPGAGTGTPNMRLNIVDTQIFSGDDGAIYDSSDLDEPVTSVLQPSPGDTTETDPVDQGGPVLPPISDTATHDFSVVVGANSAAIVIDGAVRAAVRLTTQNRLALEVRNGGVVLGDLHRGTAPPDSGCS
jgi:hypothetical protein